MELVPVEAAGVAVPSYEFLSRQVLRHHKRLTPEFTRSVQVLEYLLLSFFEHSINPEKLKEMERLINEGLTL